MTLPEAHNSGKLYKRSLLSFGPIYGKIVDSKSVDKKILDLYGFDSVYFHYVTNNETDNWMPLSNEDVLANDWEIQSEMKTDKILAAELVINLLKTLTEEINKSNNKIMEAVEAKDIVVTNSLISIQSELFEINKQLKTLTSPQWIISPGQPVYPSIDPGIYPHPWYGNPPVVTCTSDFTLPNGSSIQLGDQIKTGDPTQPIATVTDVSWYKRGESNGKE